MKTWGDVTDLPRYLKKAQALDVKLQAANDKIDAFNAEETAFNWDLTAYPQRMQIITVLKPFLQLYETAVDFETKQVRVCFDMYLFIYYENRTRSTT